jgi:hypothetical protein
MKWLFRIWWLLGIGCLFVGFLYKEEDFYWISFVMTGFVSVLVGLTWDD